MTSTVSRVTASSSSLYLSPTCQQLVHQEYGALASSRVVVRSNFSDRKLFPTISQHKCNGVCLTPAGLYTDMAETIAKHIYRQFHQAYNATFTDVGVNVYEMEVHKPFIAKTPQPAEGQWVEMEVTLQSPNGEVIDDIRKSVVKCMFRSIQPDGTKIQDQAHCLARFESIDAWLEEWSSYNDLINTKIQNLQTRAIAEGSGAINQVYRETAYSLFKSFVDYGSKYQNMSSVIFDNITLEATATLSFQPDPANDCLGPFYMDGSCHLSGFVCNAVEQNSQKNAYVSHGINGMKLSPKFKPAPGAEIRNYVRMEQLAGDKSVMQGDVYVVQDGEIVGLWEGVRFKKIPRRALDVFLPAPRAATR